MAPQGPPNGQQVQEIAYDHETAIAWSNLPEDEMIVLFTPDITQSNSNGVGRQNGPFEDLGRALASIHPGPIRHVPYRPENGLTAHHIRYIDETATILVVVCEPVGVSPDAQRNLVKQQTAFAQAAVQEYHIIHEGTEPDALIMLYCGRNTYQPPGDVGTCFRVDDYTGDYWPIVATRLLRGDEE